ncbi:hypothetical protein O6H91_02G040300 [Diphasiastrum complanatum]|uniref:Uncharacterized protein n=1 Tax=Diphasiastrum complanatum TaxID=34168 RepID=A0ACC2EEM0_DIPCM|nr:hypothetical protein O6H91_02G040300 [Diphasiastrum complanatum]
MAHLHTPTVAPEAKRTGAHRARAHQNNASPFVFSDYRKVSSSASCKPTCRVPGVLHNTEGMQISDISGKLPPRPPAATLIPTCLLQAGRVIFFSSYAVLHIHILNIDYHACRLQS